MRVGGVFVGMANARTLTSLFRFANHKNPAVSAVSSAFVDLCLQSLGPSGVACLDLSSLVRAIAWWGDVFVAINCACARDVIAVMLLTRACFHPAACRYLTGKSVECRRSGVSIVNRLRAVIEVWDAVAFSAAMPSVRYNLADAG
jgi:hypothetical protein